jgi:nucleotide-binding universal stress UspA family protein
MFEKLVKRVAARAGAASDEVLRAIDVAAAEFPDVMVEREGDAIVISGRGLLRRWLGEGRLRFGLRGFR